MLFSAAGVASSLLMLSPLMKNMVVFETATSPETHVVEPSGGQMLGEQISIIQVQGKYAK